MDRPITPADIHAAQRGLGMLGMDIHDLRALVKEMSTRDTFAARVIAMGAKQMLAAKLRMGASK